MLNQGIYKSYHKGIAKIRENKGVSMLLDSGTETGSTVAPTLATVDANTFMSHPHLHHEVFGPFSILVLCKDFEQMKLVAESVDGQLTASIHMLESEAPLANDLVEILLERAGRIVMNGVPTGVEVSAAMTHGGPYPSSTDSRFTAVGEYSIRRWIRPVTFQNFPESILPEGLKD
jgi:NADP-dependent aldehyde dehydrogenase